MQNKYYKDTKFDFGMYKGYELGLVYAFDTKYIEWCIKNLDRFRICDFEELIDFGIFPNHVDWQARLIGEADHVSGLDVYGSYQELVYNSPNKLYKYEFPQDLITKNSNKL